MPSKAVTQQTAVQLLGEQESSWRAASKRPVGRLLVFVGWPLGVVLLLAAYRELLLGAGLSGTGLTAVLLLFVPFGLFLAIGMTTWILGVVASARKRLPAALQWPVECSVKGLTVQTAIVFPIKNEDTAQVFANVATVREELRDIGADHLFDIYVVSNSDDPNCWVEEELAWHTVSRKSDRVFYWRRHRKEGRKPANIAEFCERWGSRYEYMVPFDADSLMSADTLITLVHLMECNPRTALMQTSTDQVNGQTLFARLQQFDGLDNGRLVSWGERVWQGPASTYYGHNAIIRIAPFMEHCGLPRLPGPPPFGGDLISHDYVEAALLRRAGWDVWLVPELEESYEECPATLEEFFRRDRRWRQGDITNLQLLATPKLPLTGRVRFLITALRDLSPPLLLILVGLIIGLADSPAIAASAIAIPVLIWDFSCRMGWAGVPVVSFGLSVYTRSINQDGLPVLRRFCSRILVQVLWLVAVPTRLLTYVSFVVGFACGRDVGWTTHRRTGHRSTLNHSIRAYWWHVLFGAAVTVVLILTDSWALEWLTPVLLAWILTVPLTLAFDSRRIGLLARRAGVLLTPEEHAPPPIVTRSHELAKAIRDELPPQAWHAALIEETAMAVHQAFLAHGPPLSPQDREAATAAATKYRASTASAGNHTALTNAEKMALLRDPERVWLTIPLAAPVICYPAAVPTRMPEQQLTRPR